MCGAKRTRTLARNFVAWPRGYARSSRRPSAHSRNCRKSARGPRVGSGNWTSGSPSRSADAATEKRIADDEERLRALAAQERDARSRMDGARAELGTATADAREADRTAQLARQRALAAEGSRRESEQRLAKARERLAELRGERSKVGVEEERASGALSLLEEQVRAELGLPETEPLPDPESIELDDEPTEQEKANAPRDPPGEARAVLRPRRGRCRARRAERGPVHRGAPRAHRSHAVRRGHPQPQDDRGGRHPVRRVDGRGRQLQGLVDAPRRRGRPRRRLEGHPDLDGADLAE